VSLLLLLTTSGCPPEENDPLGTAIAAFLGNLRATLDAIHKEDDRIGGRAVTQLTAPLLSTETKCMSVLSTINFGEQTDGTRDALLLVGGELIGALGRNANVPFGFNRLTRGLSATEVKTHPTGTLVFDLSRNTSAIDLVRRGLFVNFAVGEDLEIIARNLGLKRCPGISQEQLRRIIKAVAYLPKQPRQAFVEALQALTDGVEGTDFDIIERLVSEPWTVFVELAIDLATDIRGRFFLNSGEPQLTTGLTSVDTDYIIIQSPLAANPAAPNKIIEGRTVTFPGGAAGTLPFGVYLDTPLTRRGYRDGFTNFAVGGSASGRTITLGSSPGAAGTAVLVDYTAFDAHYLAFDETVRQDTQNADHWAYLADPLLSARCLLSQIRAAGIRVEVSTKL
jgi:hypothetical protein